MLSDVCSYHLTMLSRGVSQDPLNQVVAILVAGNVDQRDPRAIHAALTDSVKVAGQELGSSNLQALLNHLGGILVHAVFSRVANDVVDGSASIGRRAMLADVLNAPVSELSMSNDINVGKNLFDARALERS